MVDIYQTVLLTTLNMDDPRAPKYKTDCQSGRKKTSPNSVQATKFLNMKTQTDSK